MIIFGRKLFRRLKSLEDELGLVYKDKDFKDDYVEHVSEPYGVSREIKELNKRIGKLEALLKEKK